MAEPVVTAADRVTQDDDLPAELKGKTPKQIADHFAARERTIAQAAYNKGKSESAPAPVHTETVEVKEPTAQEFWSDPVGSTKRLAASQNKGVVTQEEFGRVTAAAMPGLEAAAKMQLREKYKTARVPFAEVEAEVEQAMATVPAEMRVNTIYWEAAYDTVKGRKMDHYVAQAETRAKQPPTERVTAHGSPEAAPAELTASEKKVIEGLGRKPERYRKAKEAMDGGGTLPYTLDNR